MSSSRQAISFERAFELACKRLRRRVCSEAQISRWLAERGASEATVRAVVVRAKISGLVDDAACARLWAEDWRRRGYGRLVIRERLRHKGLSEASIAQAAEPVSQERECAAHWLAKRKNLKRNATAVYWYRTLRSRGFSEDVIESVLGNEQE